MSNSTIIVEITASGPRRSGKTTIMAIIKKAILDAGYPVSDVKRFGDENVVEKILITTQTTRTEWTTKLPQ